VTVEGLTSLMRNSAKLTTLGLSMFKEDEIKSWIAHNDELQKITSNRFTDSCVTFLQPSFWD